MDALVYFQLIELSIVLHSLVDKVMKAVHISQTLLSVEQKTILTNQPDLQEYIFPDQLGTVKKEGEHKASLAEWQNLKFYKH